MGNEILRTTAHYTQNSDAVKRHHANTGNKRWNTTYISNKLPKTSRYSNPLAGPA